MESANSLCRRAVQSSIAPRHILATLTPIHGLCTTTAMSLTSDSNASPNLVSVANNAGPLPVTPLPDFEAADACEPQVRACRMRLTVYGNHLSARVNNRKLTLASASAFEQKRMMHQEDESADSAATFFEDVPGFDPKAQPIPAEADEDELDGPDHPDYPPASDDLDSVELFEPCRREDRVRISRTNEFPWSAICYLIITKGGRKWRGSGFFISEDAIATAGHCIYSRRSGMATRIQVVPGRDASNWPFGTAVSRRFFTPAEWNRSQDAQFDYGVLRLANTTLGRRTGHFSFENLSASRLRAAKLNTAGYPSDMTPSSALHFNAGVATQVYEQRLYYMMDTWFGASGSPVWIKTAEQKRIAVGVHNYGHCPNKATRINARVLADLQNWVND